MNLRPLGDRVVVKVEEAEEKTKSGIFIPDTAKDKPQEAKVIAVGKGILLQDGSYAPVDVAVGDKIVYSKFGGNEIKIEEEKYLIIDSRDILAVIN